MLNKVQCSNSVGKSSNETSRRLENVSREILNYYDVIYYQKKKNWNHPLSWIRHFELIKCIPFYLTNLFICVLVIFLI